MYLFILKDQVSVYPFPSLSRSKNHTGSAVNCTSPFQVFIKDGHVDKNIVSR